MPKKIDRPQEFTFSIKRQLGILSTTSTGWTKEVNLVEWNGNPAKLDIRDWDPNHEHMGRGITLHKPDTLALLEILLRNFGKDLAKTIKKTETEVTADEEIAGAAETAEVSEEEFPLCDEDGVCFGESEKNSAEEIQDEPW